MFDHFLLPRGLVEGFELPPDSAIAIAVIVAARSAWLLRGLLARTARAVATARVERSARLMTLLMTLLLQFFDISR